MSSLKLVFETDSEELGFRVSATPTINSTLDPLCDHFAELNITFIAGNGEECKASFLSEEIDELISYLFKCKAMLEAFTKEEESAGRLMTAKEEAAFYATMKSLVDS